MKAAAVLFLSSLLSGQFLLAQYQRVVYSGKGETRDIAKSHPLSYWIADPILRDDGGDLCLGCKIGDRRVAVKHDYASKADVRHLGSLAGHDIVEVVVRTHTDLPEIGGTFVWKLLLVGTKPGEYTEIFIYSPAARKMP